MSQFLLDTHLLLWAAADDARLTTEARATIEDRGSRLIYSTASIWKVAIRWATRRPYGMLDPRHLRRRLLEAEYTELPIIAERAIRTARLPLLHRDPFDRLLLAQAEVEGLTLLTADRQLATYPGPVRFVG